MRWSQATVQPFLDVHTAVLNDSQRWMASSIKRAHSVTVRWRFPCLSDQALLGVSAVSTGNAQIRPANGTSTSTIALSQRRPRLVSPATAAQPGPNPNTVQLGGFRSVEQSLSCHFLTITGPLTALTEPYWS